MFKPESASSVDIDSDLENLPIKVLQIVLDILKAQEKKLSAEKYK